MKALKHYMDSTYLKTPAQSGLSEAQTQDKVIELCKEAIEEGFYAVMIRPEYVKLAKNFLAQQNAETKVGTVIGFHEGTYSTEHKLKEAETAIQDRADDLDFVVNYEAFKKGDLDLVRKEIKACTEIVLKNNRTAKWIIEAAALTNEQIAQITDLIRKVVEENFSGKEQFVFVKSSTGFYQTEGDKPNGATPENIKIMAEHSGKLPVKAAGGVRSAQEAREMIALGVSRIGTSSAKKICDGETANAGY
ncbi:deoxyribose-phosphate aldolase [Ornithobacterium rhinotracheale]|uniref:deoxyribose-phosphate aldolase n=1 Tax=Ornithobacterium rhinotracheale TaxID=28251 RepID=UPI00129D2095|nr:deoxyribose-phosphate aldolase [Ornithobacterium rhinotracheale]MRJ08854.1 deoxyribose-phosphate aldolase [Ornithobacterium rhinotracheale]UOH77735.1 deoxyribose-phosphate aldolase [Ornithobacterium rhinotracheale]